jgi:hypothetical protein
VALAIALIKELLDLLVIQAIHSRLILVFQA